MSPQLSRQQLYDLVWSKPMRQVTPQFGIDFITRTDAVEPATERATRRRWYANRGTREFGD